MGKKRYVIEAGVNILKYLSETSRSYYLSEDVSSAIKFSSKDSASKYLDLPCLKNKKVSIKKITIKYEIEE